MNSVKHEVKNIVFLNVVGIAMDKLDLDIYYQVHPLYDQIDDIINMQIFNNIIIQFHE